MEPSKSFLVALMFVTILTLGIGTILSSLANVVVRASGVRRRAIHFAWIAIILLAYFDLFWQSDFFLTISEWRFPGFLLVISGPVMLLFATNVLVHAAIEEGAPDTSLVDPRVLLFVALLQVWLILIGVLYGDGLRASNAVDVVIAATLVVMTATRTERAHQVGTALTAVLFVGSEILIGVGVL